MTPAKETFRVRRAIADDAVAVSDLVNAAFLPDAFFKVPEFHNRCNPDGSDVRAMILNEPAPSLLSRRNQTPGCTAEFLVYEHLDVSLPPEERLLGCVFIEFRQGFGSDASEETACSGSEEEYRAELGMMSVPARNAKRGIGSVLLKAAEARIVERATSEARTGTPCQTAKICVEIHVIHFEGEEEQRMHVGLHNWYKRNGYVEVGGVKPFPPHLHHVITPEYAGTVGFQGYEKYMLTSTSPGCA